MRCMAALMLVTALAGCSDDRSFDERYDDTANQIEQRGANLDAEVDGPAADAAAKDRPTIP